MKRGTKAANPRNSIRPKPKARLILVKIPHEHNHSMVPLAERCSRLKTWLKLFEYILNSRFKIDAGISRNTIVKLPCAFFSFLTASRQIANTLDFGRYQFQRGSHGIWVKRWPR